MSLIDADDPSMLAGDGAQMFPVLQGAIKVVSIVDRLPAALSDVESAWQQLIVDHAPQVPAAQAHVTFALQYCGWRWV